MREIKGSWWEETERDPVHLAAADWLVRLQDPQVSTEETLAWQTWMKEDIRHEQAFARVEAVSQWMRQVPAPVAVSRRELSCDSYDASVALKEWRAPPRPPRIFALAASIALLITAGAVASYLRSAGPGDSARPQLFATTVGENRTLSLSDGSRITLGGDSRISVALSEHRRNIELLQGEALFMVAKDPARPFAVRAGDAVVIALGTAFDIRRATEGAVVSVTEGRVEVEPVTRLVPIALLREFKPKLRPVRLEAGEQTLADNTGIEAASKMEDPAAAISWQSGQLSFRARPLRSVLEDINRYAAKPIVLQDEELGALRITGMVTRQKMDSWLESLERGFSLHAVEEPNQIVLTRR